MEGTVLGDRDEEVSIVPVLYPHGTVSISLLGYFSSVGSSYKTSHTSFPLSCGACHIQEYFDKKWGMKQKFIMPQQENARNE